MTPSPGPRKKRDHRLRTRLDELHDRYVGQASLALDPLLIPRRYPGAADRELAAFVAAHLAYGRVAPMLTAIEAALAPLGDHPAAWAAEPGALDRLRAALGGWAWRFHTGEDLAQWILAWVRLDRESGGRGLEPHLVPGDGATADQRLSALVLRLRRELPETPGLRFNLPDPLQGAACKRWRMFLRWMVRDEWPDLGLWRDYPRGDLVMPLDTHVARISGFIGLAGRRTPDGKLAREITEALKAMCPEDPLRYDFPIAHLGILGDCPGVRRLPGCAACPLVDLCRAGG
ncbi:TIGR02757 family protein [Mesoterricola silvestris]|uniref:TIGR02757 family protein n=1 Tax=Mesoterricola silvestris TaxID=2927979 RepID=A0AA48GPS0_9BACT|nr:TIGR02757 family protein [Mesoterricola silvestris]BDU71747.1 TIGR02757 family protein [Mesoterricola silvestris]